MTLAGGGQLDMFGDAGIELSRVDVDPEPVSRREQDPDAYARHVAAAMRHTKQQLPIFAEEPPKPVRWLPIVFDKHGICTQHQPGCPRLLCPRNLQLDFAEPFVDSDGNRYAETTINDGVQVGRLGRRPSFTPLDYARGDAEIDNAIVASMEANVDNAVEVCASMIALAVRQIAEELGAADLSPEERAERRRNFDELTVEQIAAKMGVSGETLRLITNDGFAKIRAAAIEGGHHEGDLDHEIVEAVLFAMGER
jgi:hypothetical protein